MPRSRIELERHADVTRRSGGVVRALGRIRACIDAYETGIRHGDGPAAHRGAGRFDLEPVRSFAATCADLTRDIGATQLSSARWFLDV